KAKSEKRKAKMPGFAAKAAATRINRGKARRYRRTHTQRRRVGHPGTKKVERQKSEKRTSKSETTQPASRAASLCGAAGALVGGDGCDDEAAARLGIERELGAVEG